MKNTEHTTTIVQLRDKGFRKVPGFTSIMLNDKGKVFNLRTGNFNKPNNRNNIKIESSYLNVAKLVLLAFKDIPYNKAQQITYVDGNRTNNSIENIKYSRLYSPSDKIEVNEQNLITAIRCYIEVDEGFNRKDYYLFNYYLKLILKRRNFFEEKADQKHIEVFQTYVNCAQLDETRKIHDLSYRDCSLIVNSFLNMFIADVKKDFEKGFLIVLPYKKPLPTKTQQIKRYNEELIKRGKKPLPLRKKSEKEALKQFEKIKQEMKAEKPKNSLSDTKNSIC